MSEWEVLQELRLVQEERDRLVAAVAALEAEVARREEERDRFRVEVEQLLKRSASLAQYGAKDRTRYAAQADAYSAVLVACTGANCRERCEHRESDWENKTHYAAGVQDAGFPPSPTFSCAYFKEDDHV